MAGLEVVIFDVDGTLIDTSEYISQAYEHSMGFHGLPIPSREQIAGQVGKKINDCYVALAPDADHDSLISTHRTFMQTNLHLVRPFDSCGEVLEKLSLSWRLAIFTGRRNATPSLEVAGINPATFEFMVDPDLIEKGKPDPEGVHMVLGKLGVTANRATIVGDAGVDILAGWNACLAATVGITHGFGTREELEAAGADHIIGSLQELPGVIAGIDEQLQAAS